MIDIYNIIYTFKPGPKTYIAGNFKAHHTSWYADLSPSTPTR